MLGNFSLATFVAGMPADVTKRKASLAKLSTWLKKLPNLPKGQPITLQGAHDDQQCHLHVVVLLISIDPLIDFPLLELLYLFAVLLKVYRFSSQITFCTFVI